MLTGTNGQIDVLGSKIMKPDGSSVPFPFDEKAVEGRDNNMYVMEHADFLSGLLSGNLLHEGEQVAMATASGILGTLAAYTGQMVRMSDLIENNAASCFAMTSRGRRGFREGEVPMVPEFKAAVPGKPRSRRSGKPEV